MGITGSCIEDVGAKQIVTSHKRWVTTSIQQDGLFPAAVTNAKAAADHQTIVEISVQQRELTGAPGKTNLRPEVMVAGVVEIPANAHGCAREWVRAGAGDCDVKVAKLFVNGTEVFPSHAKIDRKVGLQLPIVLKKERITIGTDVVPGLSQGAGQGIEGCIFLDGGVVGEIPEIAEEILWQRAADIGVRVLVLIDVKPELQSLTTENLSGGVVNVVGGFIKNPWPIRAKDENKAAYVADSTVQNILREPERFLGIGL